ncbi:hypothetical protein H4N54_22880 [Limnospira fusiformis KN01]|uniref:Uncharacterized protein n=1 Tax=Limnospira fusiformis PMC 851.14 TaxID=2219512 RepID=A0ABU9ESN8_LIMFS|nr:MULTISPECIES: hypothetical protein [Limnospira]MDT9275617.1 hypothetical protein [Limnospira sp. PMC 737.11]ULB45217.1 hypothetical protein H4N54_22880 [Limnospira fusiformis KN01]
MMINSVPANGKLEPELAIALPIIQARCPDYTKSDRIAQIAIRFAVTKYSVIRT